MEARHSLSSLWGQGYAFFRPRARNSRHHTKGVGAAVEEHGGRRHCASHRISSSSTEGGIPINQMGTVSLSSAGCNPEMGRSTPEKLRGHDEWSRVTVYSDDGYIAFRAAAGSISPREVPLPEPPMNWDLHRSSAGQVGF